LRKVARGKREVTRSNAILTPGPSPLRREGRKERDAIPYAVDPHPKSLSLRARDFQIQENLSICSFRGESLLVRKVSYLSI
jgi:hypothetical protein